ncbi:cyanophycinase [Aquabacterium humicola]|uniref:cyanophycinase n=1 Tax=Aquabacterium humicola TaxID=3237377 RepID=UPI0025431502|nr:hypothetical protein [Rubrivivax pictus]
MPLSPPLHATPARRCKRTLVAGAAAALSVTAGAAGDVLLEGSTVAKQIMADMPGIANVVIGGGLKNCSSFNGATNGANCAKDWADILAQDPAFAGLTMSKVVFDPTYTLPTFTYTINAKRIATLNALPSHLMSAATKAVLTGKLNARLADAGKPAPVALSFADFDGGKPLYADGLAFWSNGNHADWLFVVGSMCGGVNGDAVPNGTLCTLSDANIDAVAAGSFVVAADREKVTLVLRYMQQQLGPVSLVYRRSLAGAELSPNFRAYFRTVKLAADGTPPTVGITGGLTTTEVAALRHTFVDRKLAATAASRKVETRSVMFNTDPSSVDLYNAFVGAATKVAGGQRPTIGIVTASAENPFFDRDINYYALKSAGANVVWLPVDGGLRRAIDAADCFNAPIYYTSYANTAAAGSHYHMDQAFPDLADQQQVFCANGAARFNTTLQQLHGIWFSGGDQARHLESFVTRDAGGAYSKVSAQLQVLRNRFNAGQLVVAGASAGDAVQAGGQWKGKTVPMIAGGDSWQALANGFVDGSGPTIEGTGSNGIRYPGGGLGFFSYGALDSHFSIRAREGRLVRLVKESGLDYGFGVDENTGLVVGRTGADGRTTMTVLGAGGVLVIDARGSIASGAINGNYQVQGIRLHYLSAGDRLDIDANGSLSVALSIVAPAVPVVPGAAVVRVKRVQESGTGNFVSMARTMALSGAATAYGTTEGTGGQSAPYYGFTLRRGSGTEFRVRDDRLSYTNVLLDVAPCPGNVCTAPVQ